jgi:4-amino-4-deoxy-L-arabinose transferase-like glycosyltransferase
MGTSDKTGEPASNRWPASKKELVVLLLIACSSLILLLANLGNRYLWQDEAQTALVSKTILTYGVPRGYDGKNFFSQEGGAEYGENYIWRWHTWLPFYILAAFYKVFGVSTFVSRLPFALFGFGTVILTYFFAEALWPKRRIAAILAGLLAVSVPFLLLSRQCRYYSMVMFFVLLSLYAYVLLINRKRYAAFVLFAASTLLFHSQHIYIVPLFAALLLHAVIFGRRRLIVLLAVMAATIIVNGPWFAWLSGMNYNSHFFIRLRQGIMLYRYMEYYAVSLVRHVFPVWLLAIMLVAIIVRCIKTRPFLLRTWFLQKVSLPVFFILFNIFIVSAASTYVFYRYVAPAIPLLILLIAVIIDGVADIHPLPAIATVVVLVATGPLKDYFYEITHDYDGPEKGISRYLNEHGSPDDVVAISYGDMPLKFYTKMRVVGEMTGEDLEPTKNARWIIILTSDSGIDRYLLQNTDFNRYRKIETDYPSDFWANREDLEHHKFMTAETKDKVVIYERIG